MPLFYPLHDAVQAKKKRKLIEDGGEQKKNTTVDGSNVIQSQPGLEPFPSPEARKEYYNHAYQVHTYRVVYTANTFQAGGRWRWYPVLL